jgi:hypothetical protein
MILWTELEFILVQFIMLDGCQRLIAQFFATYLQSCTWPGRKGSHPEQDVATPSPSRLPDKDQAQLDKFATYQFGDTFVPWLQKCCDCVLASLLMYHNDIVRKLGPDHAVACTLVENCLMHGISKALIKRMARASDCW